MNALLIFRYGQNDFATVFGSNVFILGFSHLSRPDYDASYSRIYM